MSQDISNSWSCQCNARSSFPLLEEKGKGVQLAELGRAGSLLPASGKGSSEKRAEKEKEAAQKKEQLN